MKYRPNKNEIYLSDRDQRLVDLLSNYFQQRGSFLAQVIKADLTNSNYLPKVNRQVSEPKSSNGSYGKYTNGSNSNGHHYDDSYLVTANGNSNGNGNGNSNGKHYSTSNPEKVDSQVIARETKSLVAVETKIQRKPSLDVEALLIKLIVEQTGYPQETVTRDLQLLDDLNLDSIKAGELVANAAQQAGVSGELDPSTLANATIKEVAEAIESLMENTTITVETSKTTATLSTTATAKIDIAQLLLNLVEAQTGFPQDTLSPELRLLDDLNLDSIKAGELVANAAQQVGVSGELDPSTLANATITEIAQVLEQALPVNTPTVVQPQPKAIQPKTQEEASWVRNFKIEYIAREKVNSVDANWALAKVLVVCDRPDSFFVTSLATELQEQQAEVTVINYQELGKIDGYTHYFAFLPEVAPDDSHLSLESMTARLKSIATAPKNTLVTYIQFGGGRFGTVGNNIHPEICNAAAFARSVHLERNDLKVRVIDLDSQIEPGKAAELILQEVPGEETIVTVGYDLDLTRWLPQSQVLQPVDYEPRSHNWSSEDVIVVTGGAKGITAECALALAESTGAKMALVGRSSKVVGEIAQTLQRFADKKLTCQYYACDIADAQAVRDLIADINTEIGKVTGIIHGAGLNTPRRVEQVTLESARKEAAPKLIGAFNLLQATAEQPIKIFAAFSSIIGVTGMAGNTWYAFANQSLALLLNRWQQQHPESDVISLAYSVWSEVGMGARMGSVKNLARMGIAAIPPQEGIDRFVGLFKGNPGVKQVVIAARLGGLDTWHPPEIVLDKQLRFIERVEYIEPGVETRVKAHLTLERDRYVGDHIWRGSYLFPTVFGLEAMAQATAYVLGNSQPEIARIENISLRRPVVVSPDKGTQIQIKAEVLEKDQQGEIKVKVGISSEQSNFSTDCFSAVLVVGKRAEPETSEVKRGKALDIVPKIDLYGGLLFQGELFQRLEKIYSLSRDLSILSVTARPSTELTNEGFGEGLGGHCVLGDAYFRDVLLQCMQVNIPQDICLPVQIDCIDFNYDPSLEQGARTLQAILHKLEGKEYLCEVIATDAEGIIRERIKGYHLRILEAHPENPTAEELANPEQRDRALLQSAVAQACETLSLTPTSLELGYLPGLGSQAQKQRRQQERPLIASALATYLVDQPLQEISFKLKTLASGKPKLTVKDYPEIDLSISHDDRYCLCSVGSEPQGCDIEVISDRALADWLALLSKKHSAILEDLVSQGDNRNCAGTRIWSATEAVRKAANGSNPEFSLVKLQGETALLEATTETGTYLVLTLKVSLTRSPERMVALVVKPQIATPKVAPQIDIAHATLEESVAAIVQPHHHLVDVTDDGPQGQRVYVQRFQVSFRQACSISRKVPVSQYISWVGKFREVPMISLAQPMLRDFYSGHYGLVTNQVTLKILGDATTYDTIQGRCWMGNLKDSSFDTYIEFCKVLPDHSLERVAIAEVKATWVKLLKYGVPTPDPLPDYLANYLKHFTVEEPASINLKNAPTVTLPQLPASLAKVDPGKVLYQATPKPRRDDLLFSNAYQTTLEETNAVGNVYYGNYFIWQNRTLDLFFFQHIPEYYRVEQAQGEVLPLYSRMTYAREGMPFDKIRVNLYVDQVTQYGASFQFQFFRENLDGTLEKLHNGEQEVVWAVRDEAGTPVPSPWPKAVLEALLQHSKTNYPLAS